MAGLAARPRASWTRWTIASRDRRVCEVSVAEDQSAACMGRDPYGVSRAERRERRSEKCLASSNAILVKSEKNWWGREGWEGPKRAMASQLFFLVCIELNNI